MHHTKLFATIVFATSLTLAACGGTAAPEPAAAPTAAQVADAPQPTEAMAEPTEAMAEPTEAMAEPTEAAPDTTAATVPDGWTTHTVKDTSLTLALPPTWEELAMDEKLLDASLDAAKEQNPEIAEMMGAQARALMQSGIKFFAFDSNEEAVTRGFATNINVIAQDLPVSNVSLDQIKDATLGQLSQLPGLVQPTTEKITLANGVEAMQVKYGFDITTQAGQATKTATTQYIILQDGKFYVVTFTTTDDQTGDYEETFSQIAQTFAFE